ncbi:hypothetical protein THAOC_28639, partial [Thalassiosira oceanica]
MMLDPIPQTTNSVLPASTSARSCRRASAPGRASTNGHLWPPGPAWLLVSRREMIRTHSARKEAGGDERLPGPQRQRGLVLPLSSGGGRGGLCLGSGSGVERSLASCCMLCSSTTSAIAECNGFFGLAPPPRLPPASRDRLRSAPAPTQSLCLWAPAPNELSEATYSSQLPYPKSKVEPLPVLGSGYLSRVHIYPTQVESVFQMKSQPKSATFQGVLSSSASGSGTRMPVKPGCFAVRWAQNLDSAQIKATFQGCLQLRKPHDAWPQDVSLPLAFDCCGMKVFCPPQQADQGPGCLSSQGVLQSDGLKISAQISNVSGLQLRKP